MLCISKSPKSYSNDSLFLRHRDRGPVALTEACGLAPAAPGDVGSDEEGAPQTAEDAEQDEGEELEQVPGRVVLHVEQHQAAISERVNGAKHERRHQGGEKGPPQRLQREVITHLRQRGDVDFRSLARVIIKSLHY